MAFTFFGSKRGVRQTAIIRQSGFESTIRVEGRTDHFRVRKSVGTHSARSKNFIEVFELLDQTGRVQQEFYEFSTAIKYLQTADL